LRVAGIVLAGGRSSRFGSDKLAAEIEGEPLLQRAVRGVGAVADDVVIVAAPAAPAPAPPAGVRARIVRDAVPDEGPLAGVVAGLLAVERRLAVIVGGDMPDLVPDVLRELLAAVDDRRAAAAALGEGDGFRPLPVAVQVDVARRAAIEGFEAGERSLRRWLRSLHATTVDEAAWTALDPIRSTLHDVDEPADLEAAREGAR
jgi:molybdopterin-guanine dinucleotide biosynthesis protein A